MLLAKIIPKALEHCRFAGSYFARKYDETFSRLNTIDQIG